MAKPTDRRTRTNDPEGMRQKLLDVAEEKFQAQGYHATSLGDLMQAASVTGGALHHHFPTKKALGLAVINERVAAVADTWIRPVEAALSARQGVRQVFAGVADQLERQGFVRGCPLNNLAHELSLADPEFRAALARIFADWQAAIADKIRSDQHSGVEERQTDPDRFAALAVATYSGAMSMAKTAQHAAVLRSCADSFEPTG